MKLTRARCGAQNGPSPRAEQCSVWLKWNLDTLSRNSACRTRFFQVQAIKTGRILIIYRQTGDLLSVSSKGTAAAKWRMKISRQFGTNCRYWLKHLQWLCFSTVQWMTSRPHFSDAGASLTEKSPLQKSAIAFCQNVSESEWLGERKCC